MYKNYENRVKDFIRDMANPSSQVVIKDITEKVDNCRLELMNESKMQKPFVFKGYLSEIDRINDTVKNNRLLFNLPDYPEEKKDKNKDKNSYDNLNPRIDFHINDNKKSFDEAKGRDKDNDNEYENNRYRSIELSRKEKISPENYKKKFKRKLSITERNQIKDLVKKDSILQPQMRFRARTDLERIYDALNGDYMRRGDREVIERQLKYINLFNYRKPKEILREDAEDIDNDNYQIKNISESQSISPNKKGIRYIYKPARIYYDARINNRKRWARKDNLNTEAKEILNSYHIKTHFKATEEVAEYNSPSKKKLNESCFILPHLYKDNRYNNSEKKKIKPINRKEIDYSKMEYTTKLFKFEEEHEKDVLDEDEKSKECNERITRNNPILRGNRIRFDPHSMEALSKLAFRNSLKTEEDNNSTNNANTEGNMINRDFEKNEENAENNAQKLNEVAKKILEECNVYTNKSKFNNSFLKAKEGKLMITKGMTIKQFVDKYKLNI